MNKQYQPSNKDELESVLKPSINIADCVNRSAVTRHEARNALTIIRVGLESCQRTTLPSVVDKKINIIMSEVDRLTRLLNELLAQNNDASLQFELLSLNEFTCELVELTQWLPAARSRCVRLIADQVDAWIRIDRNRFKQVFINLIKNACEAVSDGDDIICSLKVDSSTSQAHISIHNWGEPIPPKILPQLTQPFITTKPSGTGLGLAVVHQIIRAHSGELRITSSLELGTTVTVCLPTSPLTSLPSAITSNQEALNYHLQEA